MIHKIASAAASVAIAAACAPPLAASAPAAAADDARAIYTNTEETYFDADAGRDAAPWLSVVVEDGQTRLVDAFGEKAETPDGFSIVRRDSDTLVARVGDRETTLRRARPVTCWSALRRDTKKADGSDDWLFERALSMHDQGGRVRLGGGTSGAPETVLRMRAVTWPQGSRNRPSLVLYIHSADEPDSAISYSWASADATRVGLNLRWIQASCTIDGAERASEVSGA